MSKKEKKEAPESTSSVKTDEQVAAEKATAEKATAEKATAEKATAEKATAEKAAAEKVATSYKITNIRDCSVPVFANGAILNVGAGETVEISEDKFALLSGKIDATPYLSVEQIGGENV